MDYSRRAPEQMELHAFGGNEAAYSRRFSDSDKTVTPTMRDIPVDSKKSSTGFKHDNVGMITKKKEEIQYPGPVKVAFITLALCLAVFLVALV